METQPIVSPYPISEFVNWKNSNQLIISPKFQRRRVWKLKAQSYLIDTILKKMPIPPVYIRYIIDPAKGLIKREVVDGQQRIGTIFDYMQGKVQLLKTHNPTYAGKVYSQLPEEIQRQFLSYKLGVNMLEGISDEEVLRIFARLNTYTVPLVKQELRNAEYFGEFKQIVYDIAYKHHAFWSNNDILSEYDIARMDDAKLVSELIVTMLEGFTSTSDTPLNKVYKKYDDEFPGSNRITERFAKTIDMIGEIIGDKIPQTSFKRTPLFFSLFIFIYDAMYGIPNSVRPKLKFTKGERNSILKALFALSKILQSDEPPKKYIRLQEASRRGTADAGRRRVRHEYLWKSISDLTR